MPTETLHFENARLAQQLFNNEPRNLQALADELSVKAVSRENWIKLDGSADALERARQMFQLLESSVQNGGTVVVGGVFTQDSGDTFQKVPLLGDIPGLGWLFKNNSKTNSKSELLIFITPKIMQDSINLR